MPGVPQERHPKYADPVGPYQYLEHTADTGIIANGRSLAEVFESAAEGLASLLCEPDTVKETEDRTISVSAPDVEALMVEWLSEINYRFEVDRFAFRRFKVNRITETKLKATGRGEPIDPSRHYFGEQVKAVTYHQLEVKPGPGGWSARVILDI
ncbi:MAG: archease [Chloroflexi bacterium]|nr:archease [Chloroflexota bacterium]